MSSIYEIRELLKQMSEEQRFELIRLCNVENDKSKIDKVYLQLIITALIVGAIKYVKMVFYMVNISNSNVIIVTKIIQFAQILYSVILKKIFKFGKNTLNSFHKD